MPLPAPRRLRPLSAPPLVWTGLAVLLLACVAVSVGFQGSARAERAAETAETYRRWLELVGIERDLVYATERMQALALFHLLTGSRGDELAGAQQDFSRALGAAEATLERFIASGSRANGAARRLLRVVSEFRRTQGAPDTATASLDAVSELYSHPDWIPLTAPDGEWFDLCTFVYDVQIATYYPIETVDEYLARHWAITRPPLEPEIEAHFESVIAYLRALDLQPRDPTSTLWMLDPLLDLERARANGSDLARLVASLRSRPGAQVIRDVAPFLLHGAAESILPPEEMLDRMTRYGDVLLAGARLAVDLANARIAEDSWRERRRSAVLRNLAVVFTALAAAVLIWIELHRRRFNRRLLALAETDALTRLGNRFALQSIEPARLAEARQGGSALIQLDLDNFKAINDAFGHHVGDLALIAFAERCRGAVRAEDTVARVGGDEFVLVLHHLPDPEARAHEVVRRIQESLLEPVDCGGRLLRLQASAGIATSSGPAEFDEMMIEADLALYSAKEGGRDRHEVFADSARRTLVRELPQVLAEGRVEAVFQPQLDLLTGEIVGVEALARWPLGPEMPAAKMIEVVEWLGQTRALLRCVLARVEEAYAETGGRFHGRFWLNLSPLDLVGADSAAALLELLGASSVPPERLGVEITEGLPIVDLVQAANVLTRLREEGLTVAIDDFGSQNTPLRHLTRFEVDLVKLDRSVVSRIDVDRSNRVLVDAMRVIGEAHGMIVLAEGVETEGEMATLRRLGILRAQGHAVAPPMSAEELARFLTDARWPAPPGRKVGAGGAVRRALGRATPLTAT